MQGHHLARVPVVQGVNGVKPETGGKDPIEGRGGTTSLHMTQDRGACLSFAARRAISSSRNVPMPMSRS